ncbi:MAG: TIGR04168 family protein [Planctomycetes bacterium]|nr:TIGR04168 family protein [Planctomycetota bacterium]
MAPGNTASATMVVIGDLHGQWRPADRAYLEDLGPDLALFVGDLSDTEEVSAAEAVAAIQVPKVALLGNHDAWRSIKEKRVTDTLIRSIDALGSSHLAYEVYDVPSAQVSVVGARPFSYGGPQLRGAEVYDELYGVRDFESSAQRIVKAAQGAQHADLIILAHNGPTGLGSEPADICGKDFGQPGGDWGDRDLELAIELLEGWGFRIRAVISGHMHHLLLHPRKHPRRRFVRRDGTLFINCAVVPRIEERDSRELAYFLRMTWEGGECLSIREVWVDADGQEQVVVEPDVVGLDGPASATGEA